MSPMNNERFGLAAARPLVATLRDKGTIWYSTDTDEVWTSDGVDWTQLGGGGGGGAGVGSTYAFSSQQVMPDSPGVPEGQGNAVTLPGPVALVVTNPSATLSMRVQVRARAAHYIVDVSGLAHAFGFNQHIVWTATGIGALLYGANHLTFMESSPSVPAWNQFAQLEDLHDAAAEVIPPSGVATYHFNTLLAADDGGIETDYDFFSTGSARIDVIGVLV